MILASVTVMALLAWFIVVTQPPSGGHVPQAGAGMGNNGRRELTWRSGLQGIALVVAASVALATVGGLLALLMWWFAT